VHVAYGDRAVLADVSWTLRAGAFLAICGPNGAGKSTLLRAAAGLLAPARGAVTLDGRAATAWTARERAMRIGYLPQHAADLPGFSCRAVVRMGRYAIADEDRDAGTRAVDRAMARTDTRALADRPFDEISGGERQRVLVARALAQSAPILLFDEPTTHLDLANQVAIAALLQSLAADGAAVACALHDLNLAAAFATRVLLLAHGRVVADDVPERTLQPGVLGAVFGVPLVGIAHPHGGAPVLATARGENACIGG